MSNTTGNDRLGQHPWNAELSLRRQFAIPAADTTFYSGQFVGRDASGNIVQADDTAKYELVGILQEVLHATVATSDTLGDKLAQQISRPLVYTVKIAAALAGDEGRKVFVRFNNEVQYTPGTNANFAGWVWRVVDSTHVAVTAPWANHVTDGGTKGVYTAAAAASTTLTKWDINKVVLLPLTSAETIYLPPSAACSPGDRITFINTSANTSTPTLSPPASGAGSTDTINGSATYTMSSAQYSVVEMRTDAAGNWYCEVPGPSGTVGATTFSGNVAVSSATLTVTSNSANALDVGPNGATNPTLQVDGSTSSAATGLKIKSAAAAAGLALSVISSGTDENMTINAKGAGTITLNGTATGGITLGTAVTASSSVKSTSASAGIGYATGAGAAVTQASSRTTTVVCSAVSGAITLVSAAGSATPFTFTVTNTAVAATDTIIVSQKSGTDAYEAVVSAVGAGSFKITITDLTGTTTEQPVFNFAVIKAVAA